MIIILVIFAIFPLPVFAYVDPGSGSAIVTAVLGAIAAVGYIMRKSFYKIKRKLLGKKRENNSQLHK
tara:strand:- start:303 stop:503 length:201 start_codon:yes stop_codon:yes gene_type:complete